MPTVSKWFDGAVETTTLDRAGGATLRLLQVSDLILGKRRPTSTTR